METREIDESDFHRMRAEEWRIRAVAAEAEVKRLTWTAEHRWKEAEKLEAERDKLKEALEAVVRECADHAASLDPDSWVSYVSQIARAALAAPGDTAPRNPGINEFSR